jgi:Protein of unknown function (DUF3592)
MSTSTIIFYLVAVCLMLLIVVWPVIKIKWYVRYRPNKIHQAELPRKRRLVGLIIVCIIGIPSICGIAWILYRSVEDTIYALSSQNWPKVDGMIVNSYVDSYQDCDTDHSCHTAYKARINYNYVVKGETFNNNRVTFRIAPSNSKRNSEYSESLVAPFSGTPFSGTTLKK